MPHKHSVCEGNMSDVLIGIIPSTASIRSSYLVNKVLNALAGYYELLADTPVLDNLFLQKFISFDFTDVKDLTKVINRDYVRVIRYFLNHNLVLSYNILFA